MDRNQASTLPCRARHGRTGRGQGARLVPTLGLLFKAVISLGLDLGASGRAGGGVLGAPLESEPASGLEWPAMRHERASQPATSEHQETGALLYLQRYGYMSSLAGEHAGQPGAPNNRLVSEESFSEAVASFQRFAGIPETGRVDEQTWRMMQLPRCGNLDRATGAQAASGQSGDSQPAAHSHPHQVVSSPAVIRKRRFALQGSKWRRQELTYRISQYPSRFAGKRHEVDQQIERAFGIWSQVAPINFVVKRDGKVHIDIRFASGDHGDGDSFDGPGNTLAHAYFPQYGGDAHFDDQEYWTIDSYAGTNIFQVAAHELGHSLGLGHSNVREALMAPFYQKYKPNFKLHLDDQLAIQALYGEKPAAAAPSADPPPPASGRGVGDELPELAGDGRRILGGEPRARDTPAPEEPVPSGGAENGLDAPAFGAAPADRAPAPAPDLCADSAIDAATRTEDGASYVFKGDHYWQLAGEGVARGFPRLIQADWEGLPGSLDAALTWADGKTFFFKGNKYWRYRNKRRDLGYPKLISSGFAGIPDDIDAALVWAGNGRTYIFKGAHYWRFDSRAEPPVAPDYPRLIARTWEGVPAHLNAALRWENNVTYFFKGRHYYRFNDREFKVEPRGRPPFPRPTAEWWFGCPSPAAGPSLGANLNLNLGQGLSLVQRQPANETQLVDWPAGAPAADPPPPRARPLGILSRVARGHAPASGAPSRAAGGPLLALALCIAASCLEAALVLWSPRGAPSL